MDAKSEASELTSALEDYVETIADLSSGFGVARVRDIARIRGVKPGSVSPALRRLASLGLVSYLRRESVALTTAGESVARRVGGRHTRLAFFFREVLGVPSSVADRDACIVEHQLSDETMTRLVRLSEHLRSCPAGRRCLASIFTDGTNDTHAVAGSDADAHDR